MVKLGQRLAAHRLHLGAVGHIGPIQARVAALCEQLVQQRTGRLFTAKVVNENRITIFGKKARARTADAAGRAGNQGNLAHEKNLPFRDYDTRRRALCQGGRQEAKRNFLKISKSAPGVVDRRQKTCYN